MSEGFNGESRTGSTAIHREFWKISTGSAILGGLFAISALDGAMSGSSYQPTPDYYAGMAVLELTVALMVSLSTLSTLRFVFERRRSGVRSRATKEL